MQIALWTAATDKLTEAFLDTKKAIVCTNPQHPRPQLFGDVLLGYHGVATTTAVPGPCLCCGSLFRFVRAFCSCVCAPGPLLEAVLAGLLFVALDALSSSQEMAAESPSQEMAAESPYVR